MIEIRNAKVDELELVAKFYHDMWHESQAPFQDNRIAEFRDLPFMRARIDEFFPHIFIAISARIVGFVVAHDGRLSQLFVDPNARGHGLGAELLKLAEAKLRAEGTVFATLSCIKGNSAARRFYERYGWSVIEERCKLGETHDGWIAPVHIWEMRKSL